MKMKSLLFGVIFGLFAVVRSTPVNTVTHIPDKATDEVIQEAMTDEFLVDQALFPSLTTAPPKRNTTVQASHQPPSDTEESDTQTLSDDVIEISAAGETNDKFTNSVFFQGRGEHYATTTLSSTSTVLPRDTDDSTSDSSTTQSPQSDFTSSMPNVALSSVTADQSLLSILSSDLGSGEGEIQGQDPATSSSMTSSSNTETSTASSTSTTAVVRRSFPSMFARSTEGSGSGLDSESGSGMSSTTMSSSPNTETSTSSSTFITTHSHSSHLNPARQKVGNDGSNVHKGHTTPDWIIILGFVVGVAALIMLCAAIATRDKWNRSNQKETETNSSHQQREVEMETFLHNDVPKENGKSADYTVIPLDELPEKNSH